MIHQDKKENVKAELPKRLSIKLFMKENFEFNKDRGLQKLLESDLLGNDENKNFKSGRKSLDYKIMIADNVNNYLEGIYRDFFNAKI